MLSKMFKGQNPFADQDPKVRKTALEQLDASDPEAQAIIVDLLNTDSDLEVRRSAARLCPDIQALCNFLTDPDLGPMVITRVQQEVEDLVELTNSHPQAEIRQRLSAFIEDEEQLIRLEKLSRDHDKTLNRYARDTLQHKRNVKSETELAQAQGEQIIERLENHLNQEMSSSWQAKAELLMRQWQEALPQIAAPDELLPRYLEIVQKFEKLSSPSVFFELKEQAREIQQQWHKQWPIVIDAFEQWQKAWLTLAKNQDTTAEEAELFVQLCDQGQQILNLQKTTHHLQTLLAKKPRAPALSPTSANDFQKLWRQATNLSTEHGKIKALISKLNWPTWLATPLELAQVDQHLQSLDESVTAISGVKSTLKSRFSDTKNRLEETLANGQSNLMGPLLAECRELLKQLPKAQAEAGRDEIDVLGARFDELRDWKKYATDPKRQTYCQEMELLINSNTPVVERAEAIKDLRNRWNQLGFVGGKIQKRFNEAADKAFEPCKAYFDAQAKLRTQNLKSRKGMLAQLNDYLENTDWQQPDVKAAESILRSTRKEWGQYHPIPRGQSKALEKKLDSLMDQLHGNIKKVWQKNIDAKEAIVSQAKEIMAAESGNEEKIGTLKTLQAKWKAVGTTPRGPDQKLWKAFRSVCDEAFGHRDQERDTQNKADDDLREQAITLIKELYSVIEKNDPLTLTRDKLREYQSTFHALNVPKGLADKFTRATTEFTKLIKHNSQRKIQQQTLDLEHQDKQISVWERDKNQPKPENLADCFTMRLAETIPIADDETLRKLVVNAELLAGVDSPPGDASLRMSVQVEHLKSGLGQREKIALKPTELAHQWCENSHSNEDIEPLRQRFFSAITQMFNK